MRRFIVFMMPLVAACAVLGPAGLLPPWRVDRLNFSHTRHIKAEVECLACHETVYDAENLEARHLPAEKKCLECHAEWKEAGRCETCHTDVQAARHWAPPKAAVTFSHAAHLERTNEECVRCHSPMSEPGRPAAPVVMDNCTNCHTHKQEFSDGNCRGCHTDLSTEKLKPLREFTHQGNFVAQHRLAARSSADSCMACHTQSQCVECHNATPPVRVELQQPEAVTRNLIHRNDYISRHSLEALADPSKCYRCHGNSFCNDCHKAQNLTSTGNNPRNPHPPGWVMGGAAQSHGMAARRDIQQCASCHDQGPQTNCITCHLVGGIGGNPHPPGWQMQNNQRDIGLNGMCASCHRQ